MKEIVFLAAIAQLLIECNSYTYCTYTHYDVNHIRRYSRYTCASNEYCCGTQSCCTVVYARWYLWFVLSTVFMVIFIIWWYYRYRYAPRRRMILTTAPVATTTVAYPQGRVPTAYPTAAPGPICMSPGGGTVYYNNYNKPGYPQGPPPTYAFATSVPIGMPPPGNTGIR